MSSFGILPVESPESDILLVPAALGPRAYYHRGDEVSGSTEEIRERGGSKRPKSWLAGAESIWILTLGLKLLSSKFQLLNGKSSAHDTLKQWTVN